jgi:hypothetical protein
MANFTQGAVNNFFAQARARLEQSAANTAATQQSTSAAKIGAKAASFQLSEAKRKALAGREAQTGIGDSMQSMIENYNLAFGEAKEANEARYQQQLGIADATTGQRLADVSSAFGRQGADIGQRLAGLGMSGTTIAPTMQLGVERERQSALNRTADEMQQTKLGIIGAREDQYPDLGSLQSTLAGAASGEVTPQVAAMLKAFGNIRSV